MPKSSITYARAHRTNPSAASFGHDAMKKKENVCGKGGRQSAVWFGISPWFEYQRVMPGTRRKRSSSSTRLSEIRPAARLRGSIVRYVRANQPLNGTGNRITRSISPVAAE